MLKHKLNWKPAIGNLWDYRQSIFLLATLIFGFGYWASTFPDLFVYFGVIFLVISTIGRRFKLNLTQILRLTAGITMAVSYQTASHAAIFEALETAMTTALTQGTGGAIDATVITGFFVFIRVVIGIGFIVGIVMAIVRAVGGADWSPVATALGIAVFGVVAIELMTNLLIGAGGGGTDP